MHRGAFDLHALQHQSLLDEVEEEGRVARAAGGREPRTVNGPPPSRFGGRLGERFDGSDAASRSGDESRRSSSGAQRVALVPPTRASARQPYTGTLRLGLG